MSNSTFVPLLLPPSSEQGLTKSHSSRTKNNSSSRRSKRSDPLFRHHHQSSSSTSSSPYSFLFQVELSIFARFFSIIYPRGILQFYSPPSTLIPSSFPLSSHSSAPPLFDNSTRLLLDRQFLPRCDGSSLEYSSRRVRREGRGGGGGCTNERTKEFYVVFLLGFL